MYIYILCMETQTANPFKRNITVCMYQRYFRAKVPKPGKANNGKHNNNDDDDNDNDNHNHNNNSNSNSNSNSNNNYIQVLVWLRWSLF